MVEFKPSSLREALMSPEAAALKGLLARFYPDACVVLASGTCVAAALGTIQGILGVVGAALSVVYLLYRIKKIKKDS